MGLWELWLSGSVVYTRERFRRGEDNADALGLLGSGHWLGPDMMAPHVSRFSLGFFFGVLRARFPKDRVGDG